MWAGSHDLLPLGSDNPGERANVPLETLAARLARAEFRTRFYNPVISCGSFALPQYVVEL